MNLWILNASIKGKKAVQNDVEAAAEPLDTIIYENDGAHDSLLISYIDQFRPVCQQWHLQNLLAAANKDATDRAEIPLPTGLECLGKLDLNDIALFYSNMLKIYSVLNPIRGSLPVLNMLSFTPGFIVKVWHVLEDSIFHGDSHTSDNYMGEKSKHNAYESRLKHVSKDGANKWVSVLHKLTGKSHAASNNAELICSHPEPSQMNEDSSDVWDNEPMRCGPQGICKDTFALLHIFCATYAHLLLVLDDIEFYEKQHYDGDVEELSLDFTVTEESFGKWHVVELRSGGKDILVTDENKMQYIHAMADYKLNQQILPFSNAFYRGLTDLISPSWLKLFNASEFNQLLSGGKYDIDIDDLKNNTRYTGGYNEGSRTVKIFWEVIKDFEPQERCMLLKFVTSCSRAPLLGFKYLQPTFTIHK